MLKNIINCGLGCSSSQSQKAVSSKPVHSRYLILTCNKLIHKKSGLPCGRFTASFPRGVLIASRSAHWTYPHEISTPSVVGLSKMLQRVFDFQKEFPNMAIYLKISLPLEKTYSKSSTGGVWIINGFVQ